jgi:hypothetical protein
MNLQFNKCRRKRLAGTHVPNTNAIEHGDIIELNGAFWLADKWYVDGWNFFPMNEHGTAIASKELKFFRHGEIMTGHALYAEV